MKLTRDQILALASILLAAVAVIVSVTVPEMRQWLGLDPAPAPFGQTTPPAGPNTNSPPGGGQTSAPSDDFEGGSRRVYSADFSTWPLKGEISLGSGKSLIFTPSSNNWVITSEPATLSGLDGDFVIDWHFRIPERSPSAALSVKIAGSGADATEINLYLDVWSENKADYSIDVWVVRSTVPPYSQVVRADNVADREHLGAEVSNHDWSKPSRLTLKRTAGKLQFFINGVFVREFRAEVFPVAHVGLEAAFPSKIEITEIEARVKA